MDVTSSRSYWHLNIGEIKLHFFVIFLWQKRITIEQFLVSKAIDN